MDLKYILSCDENKKNEKINYESNINNIFDIINKDSNKYNNNWNKLSKSKKKKLLNKYILYQKNNNNLTDEIEEVLKEKLFNEFNRGNIKNNDIVLNEYGNIEKIKPLQYDEKNMKYNYIKKNTYQKSNTKSKSNIERILK